MRDRWSREVAGCALLQEAGRRPGGPPAPRRQAG